MTTKPQSTTESPEAPERIWIAPTTIKKREGRIYTAPGRRDNEIEYARVHAPGDKVSEVEEPDIYDLVADYRDRIGMQLCAHCAMPITEGVTPNTWVHTKTGLTTCRKSGASNHEGIFHAEPSPASAAPVVDVCAWCKEAIKTAYVGLSGERYCSLGCQAQYESEVRRAGPDWERAAAAATAAPQQSRSNHFPDEALNRGFPDHISRDGAAHYGDGTVLPSAAPVDQSDAAKLAAAEIAQLEKPNHTAEAVAMQDCDICNAYRQKIAAIIERHYKGAR